MSDEPTFSNYEGSVTYVDQAMLDKLAEAMIDAYMRREFTYVLDGSCSEGKFEYRNPGNQYSGYYHYDVSYPDGKWTNAQTGESVSDALTVDVVSQVYDVIKNDVDTYLAPYMNAPRPGDFTGQVAALQDVVQHLSVSGEARVTGEGTTTAIEVGDQLVPQYLSEIGSQLADLDGVAMNRLRQVYGRDRIEDVMTGLHALATVGGVLVAGEQQVWARFHRDFHKLIDTSTSDFHAFSEDNEVSAGEIFDVVLSLADASGVFSLPAGAADAIGKASTLGGIVQGFLPEPPAPHEYTLDGGSWSALSESFWTARDDLASDVDATEAAFTQCATNAFDAATDFIGPTGEYLVTTSFDLKNPTEFLRADDRGIYRDENGARVDIAVTDNALRQVSGRYEAIGDHCNGVAGRLDAAPSSDPWFREFTTAGTVYGHYEAFLGITQWVAGLLRNNAAEMHRVGEKCLVVLHDFNATDGTIEAELNRETRDVVRQAMVDASP